MLQLSRSEKYNLLIWLCLLVKPTIEYTKQRCRFWRPLEAHKCKLYSWLSTKYKSVIHLDFDCITLCHCEQCQTKDFSCSTECLKKGIAGLNFRRFVIHTILKRWNLGYLRFFLTSSMFCTQLSTMERRSHESEWAREILFPCFTSNHHFVFISCFFFFVSLILLLLYKQARNLGIFLS